MAEHLIQEETLTGLAGSLRMLSGSTDSMNAIQMQPIVDSANTEISAQKNLIEQIIVGLHRKAVGGENLSEALSEQEDSLLILEAVINERLQVSQANTPRNLVETCSVHIVDDGLIYDGVRFTQYNNGAIRVSTECFVDGEYDICNWYARNVVCGSLFIVSAQYMDYSYIRSSGATLLYTWENDTSGFACFEITASAGQMARISIY